ncbi:MAG: cell surface protein SprA [Gemmatimonadales bacterium]
MDCAAQRAGPFEWEILQEARDYYVDPSGAWFALANRLDQSDYLAVSYITASGADSVGTLPTAANPDTTVVDTLRLVYDPRPGVTAAAPSFRFELRNAYRVGGREVERASLELALTVNRRERSLAGEPYLALLGLALAHDADRVDEYNRVFPRTRDPSQGEPVRDLFVVFPHLTPFADSTRLTAAERNDSLYRTPRLYLTSQAPPSVFALRFHFAAAASADRALLSLNSFQIREASERIYVRDRLLTRGTDYTIDYTTGQVQFTNPDALFQGGAAQVRAQFEERAAFNRAPTSIYGLAARYDLGATGQVHLTGLFQSERSTFTRPPLGFEPASSFIGGLSTELRFDPEWLTRAADALPGVRTDVPSSLTISAELAVSRPAPNRFGQAYLEEFETGAARFIALTESAWHWGATPTSVRGAEALGVTGAFDTSQAAFLTWQNLPYELQAGRFTPLQFLPQEIDPTLRFAGQTQAAEPVLWLTLHPDTVLGLAHTRLESPLAGRPNWTRAPQDAPRWRSLTHTLSATGIDLSRTEFLEFWVWEDGARAARANQTVLLLDFGSVFEDALAFVPEFFTVSTAGDTTYGGRRRAGAARLDSERDLRTRTWSASLNDEGILSDRVVDGIVDSSAAVPIDTLPLCSATRDGQVVPYALGDIRSRCGRRNGAVDTEDQDGDFALDSLTGVRTGENFVRFVFPIGDPRYYVRDGGMRPDPSGTGIAGWRLYRIPFRTDTLRIGDPNLRQIQALRITVVTPQAVAGAPDPRLSFALARVRLIGSSWVKRGDTPLAGIAGGGERATGTGEVVAAVVSTENQDLGYTSPPGVGDQAGRRDAGFDIGATQINERSLRLLARGLGPGERAEAYLRFTAEGDKNFLKYRRLRVWARGRGPGWEDGDLEFFLKVGKDEHNFYLYHVPARSLSWEPEVVADLERWLVLRARIEQAWLAGDTAQTYPGCPDTTLLRAGGAYVMCDGPYIAHVRDPGTAPPNLARVQEIAAGMWRVDSAVVIDQAELWVDDVRLSNIVQETGAAGAIDVTLAAADVADLSLSWSRRDAQFRQLGDNPSYVTQDAAAVAGTLRLDRLLPDGWGLSLPLTVRHARNASDPFYLNRSDVRADAVPGLRRPRTTATSYTFSARRVRRAGPGSLAGWLLDPLSLSGSYTRGTTRAELSQGDASSYAFNLDYTLLPRPRAVRIAGATLRINPASVRLRSGLSGGDAERFTYRFPVARPGDSLPPVRSQSRLWRNSGALEFLPLSGVQLGIQAATTRDLRDYGDSTTMGRLLGLGRRTLLGRDIGIETQRSVGTSLVLTPRLATWLRPRASLVSSFTFARDPNAPAPVRTGGDTAGALRVPAAFSSSRRFELGGTLDLRRFAQAVFGDSAPVADWLGRIQSVDASYTRQRGAVFNRAGEVPPLGFQLGLGGLDAFRHVNGVAAVSASEHVTVTAGAVAALGWGLRATASYRRTRGLTWARRADEQVPLRVRTLDWPSGTLSWTFTAPRGGLGRVLSSGVAQLTYRRSETASEQPTFAAVGSGLVAYRTSERTVAPAITLTWAGGVLTTFDATRTRRERLAAGSLFRSIRGQQNATLSFAFWPPGGAAGGWRAPIRTSARYSVTDNTTCLRSAGQTACVPYVDSRQMQAHLTMDTDLPSNASAGLQVAYVLTEERQTNRKVAQFVVTAFVQLATSVGQLR